ncbi:MAG: DUF3866 family protein, partial [Armatimonadetes bacterium]|nr:DUF3866 family protein [Armatimonadota bacterium]
MSGSCSDSSCGWAVSPGDLPPALSLRPGRVVRLLAARPGCEEWEVEWEGGQGRGIAYPALTPPLSPGVAVWLNTTASELSLGTGGVEFVVAQAEPGAAGSAFPLRRADGHVLRVRYTPLQHRVCVVEDEASPHRERFLTPLPGPWVVLAAELHSQALAALIAAHGTAPQLRLAYLQLDSAALPLAFSRCLARLVNDGVIQATITVGQGFGGSLEAVNVYSGLAAARNVASADLVVVGQGPGNVGTGTEYGFSGLALAEALHAAEHLGAEAHLAPRLSAADPRP